MEMKMRESRVLKKLRAGEIVNCFKVNFCDGRLQILLPGTDLIVFGLTGSIWQVTGMYLMLRTGQQNLMMLM